MPGKTILVANDDPNIRFLLRLIFEGAGYRVAEAQNGISALIRIKDDVPDLLVTDTVMPVVSGVALIEHLRSEASTAGIRILAVTANGRSQEAAANADAVVGEPFDRSELLAIVSELLAEESNE